MPYTQRNISRFKAKLVKGIEDESDVSSAGMRIPRFHSVGDDDGHFYAVAYVIGAYVPPSRRARGDAFFVLDFSSSRGFTRFSYSTLSHEGHLFHYSRGVDALDTLEYALLRAWHEEGVPIHAWRLFPSRRSQRRRLAERSPREASMRRHVAGSR
jgi:hypothetical protein